VSVPGLSAPPDDDPDEEARRREARRREARRREPAGDETMPPASAEGHEVRTPFSDENKGFHTRAPIEPQTVEDFTQALALSGLMPAAKLEQFRTSLSADEEPQDAKAFANLLVKYRRLTRYQADVLTKGHTRGLVLGNYEVRREIGEGGMGMVFEGRHRRMKRKVALKVLHKALTDSEDGIGRFHREVEAAAKLQHPNIAAAYDADEEDGIHFLVMELVEGPDLAGYVKEAGALPPAVAVQLITQAARGLAHAHSQGVVHRDIKPANLLVRQDGVLKILDMGLAQITSDAEERSLIELTQTGRAMGTVDYMAPEQALDARSVDSRADIYSLGSTLYFLMAGKPMSPDGPLVQKMLWHQSGAIPSLRDVVEEVPESLDTLFQKMVAKKPEGRPQSMDEVVHDLEACMVNFDEGGELPLQGNDLARYIGITHDSPATAHNLSHIGPALRPVANPGPEIKDPDLAKIIEVWTKLPDGIRVGIMAMVNSAAP